MRHAADVDDRGWINETLLDSSLHNSFSYKVSDVRSVYSRQSLANACTVPPIEIWFDF
jgi:hypothetical protein